MARWNPCFSPPALLCIVHFQPLVFIIHELWPKIESLEAPWPFAHLQKRFSSDKCQRIKQKDNFGSPANICSVWHLMTTSRILAYTHLLCFCVSCCFGRQRGGIAGFAPCLCWQEHWHSCIMSDMCILSKRTGKTSLKEKGRPIASYVAIWRHSHENGFGRLKLHERMIELDWLDTPDDHWWAWALSGCVTNNLRPFACQVICSHDSKKNHFYPLLWPESICLQSCKVN